MENITLIQQDGFVETHGFCSKGQARRATPSEATAVVYQQGAGTVRTKKDGVLSTPPGRHSWTWKLSRRKAGPREKAASTVIEPTTVDEWVQLCAVWCWTKIFQLSAGISTKRLKLEGCVADSLQTRTATLLGLK